MSVRSSAAHVFHSTAAGTANQIAHGVATDSDGNVYVTGDFAGTVDFGSGHSLTSSGATDVFVVKLDKNGNWNDGSANINDKSYDYRQGSGGTETGEAIAVDSAGLAYITGQTAANDAFVTRLAADGTLDTGFHTTGEIVTSGGNAHGRGIAVDGSGNVYATGSFSTTVDFHAAASVKSNGSTDIFVWKLDSTGAVTYANGIGDAGADVGNAIAVDAAGNTYVAGSFSGTVDFNTGGAKLISAGATDGFVLKLNARVRRDSRMDWAEPVPTPRPGSHWAKPARLVVSGSFVGAADFPVVTPVTHLTGSATGNAFVAQMNTAGSVVLAQQLGGGTATTGLAITADQNGNIFTTGSFAGTNVSFNPDKTSAPLLTSAGTNDLFVWRLHLHGCAHRGLFHHPAGCIDDASRRPTAGSRRASVAAQSRGRRAVVCVGSQRQRNLQRSHEQFDHFHPVDHARRPRCESVQRYLSSAACG